MSGRPRRQTAAALEPRVELLCVGSELLNGQVNTHQSHLALRLKSAGLRLARECSLPDDAAEIAREVRRAAGRADALILCGGLGPTFDDLSREGVCRALGRDLRYRPSLFSAIRGKFRRHGLKVPAENRRQAFVIEGARVLPNRFGSAPGQLLVEARAGRAPLSIALLPGPLAELSPIFEDEVLPHLRRTYARGRRSAHLCVHLSGVPESQADEALKPLTARPGPGESYTILASTGQVDFHATATAPTAAAASRLLARIRRRVYALVGRHVFGEGDETLEAVLGEALRRRRLSLAVAESCTAGLVAARLTAVAGSSRYFKGGALVYEDALKTRLLGVRPATLLKEGAVSRACAREMAEGARRLAGAGVGLAVTGIAGPGGGSARKPVGLVFIALAGPGARRGVWRLRLPGERETVRRRAAVMALHLALRHLGRA